MRPSAAGFAAVVQDLGGWRAHVAALAAGAISVLALAPFFAWPVLFLTLPIWVWLIDGACRRAPTPGGAGWLRRRELAAAAVGWWFGFGYFLAGLFWIGEAFLVDAATFAVLLPFAVTLLPAGLALYYAAAAAVAARFWRSGPARVVVLALSLSAAEWLRGHWLSGFPWNLLGYALTYPLALMQCAAVVGVYALGLIAVLVFALPLVLWSGALPGRAGRSRRALAAAVAIVPLAIGGLLGSWRLSLSTPPAPGSPRLRLVQPNVPEREKWRPENRERIFGDLLALSQTGPGGENDAGAGITHVLWPEAALPFLLLDQPGARAAIGRMLPAGGVLITGALRAEPASPGRPLRVFNSILVLGQGGALLGGYDKIQLVPFGEYLPLQAVLESVGLRQLTQLRGGFTAGLRPRPLLNVPGLPPAVPLICYEAIFPRGGMASTQRPGALLNVTNDAWFGDTTGPRQHFHQARVRAVEEGVALIRVANTGISAVIDGYGRVRHRLGLNHRGTIDAELPPALPPTPYARFGDGLFLLLWVAGVGALLWDRSRSRRGGDQHATAGRRAGPPQLDR